MKRILLACDPARMDVALRRSLAHLITSCDISIVHNGHAAFDEIGSRPFDLIIVDFQLSGIDSLELLESLQYIDPGVPAILMIDESNKSIRHVASRGSAQSILTPFNPLKFLRLVDKLLHQQLNRYRQLANTLQEALESLRTQTDTPLAFLVEESGQILLASGDTEGELLERLGNLAVGVSMLDEELERLFVQDEKLRTDYLAKKDHGLYVLPVTPNLRLALLSPLVSSSQTSDQLWELLDKLGLEIQIAFDRYSRGVAVDDAEDTSQLEILRDHVFIPLSLDIDEDISIDTVPVSEKLYDNDEEEEIAVNWDLLSSNSNVLSRLQNFIHTDN